MICHLSTRYSTSYKTPFSGMCQQSVAEIGKDYCNRLPTCRGPTLLKAEIAEPMIVTTIMISLRVNSLLYRAKRVP
jgi:hypothetical protein